MKSQGVGWGGRGGHHGVLRVVVVVVVRKGGGAGRCLKPDRNSRTIRVAG